MGAASALLDKPDPILPSKKDTELATESSRVLSATANDDEFRVQLEGGERLVLPSGVKTLLVHLLTEMSRGNAVRIIPVHAVLTTQEAADFLNVSRPHLIGLLKNEAIPHHMVGTHRRIRFNDLVAYKQRREADRDQAMNELVDQAQGLEMGY